MAVLPVVPAWVQDQILHNPVTKYTRRVDIYEANGTSIWRRDVPIVSGSITVDQARAERRTADLVLYNLEGSLDRFPGGGLWYDKVVKIYMGIDTPAGKWETILGTFLIDTIAPDLETGEIGVTCRDYAKKMSFDLPYTLGWAANTPIEVIIGNIAAGVGVTAEVPHTAAYVYEETFIEAGKARWAACYELATAHGYDLFFKPDGTLKMVEFADPATEAPEIRFETGARSNVSTIGYRVDDTRIRNHIAVTGEDPEGAPVWGEAINENLASPTNIFDLGYRTKHIKSDWVQSFEQCQDYAQRMLAYESLESYEANLGILVFPWLEVGCIAQFVDPNKAFGDPDEYLLSNFSINLDLSPISATLKRVTNVINRQKIYPAVDLFPSYQTYPN